MAFDLDDEELEATRKLNGVAKDKIEEDIKIVKSLIKNTKESLINNTELSKYRKTNRIIAYKATEHLLSDYTRQKQINEEYQKEKRENQKVELAVLNEKQKDMNKLINTVKTYKGQFKRQEEVIRQLKKENKEKDKYIKDSENITTEMNNDINKLLMEIKEKDKLYHKALGDLVKADRENIQLKKQIDLMATTLSAICTGLSTVRDHFEKEYCEFINSDKDCCWKTDTSCKDCIKQYFESKVEE